MISLIYETVGFITFTIIISIDKVTILIVRYFISFIYKYYLKYNRIKNYILISHGFIKNNAFN